jgi:hypothetical protein
MCRHENKQPISTTFILSIDEVTNTTGNSHTIAMSRIKVSSLTISALPVEPGLIDIIINLITIRKT